MALCVTLVLRYTDKQTGGRFDMVNIYMYI